MAPLSRSKDSYNIGRNHAPTYVPVEVMNECSKVSSSQRAIPELGVNHAEVGYSPNGINEKTTNVGVSLQNSPQTIPSGGNVPIEPIPPSLNPEADNEVFQLVHQLLNPVTRERALSELSKKRETYEDIALVLWYSFGAIAVLLQEIISVYPMLQPPSLTNSASNRICNALALFQSVASHRETREHFFNAHIPLFLYPFLNTTSKTKSFEYLRLTSLGVVGALVKSNSPKTIRFLLSTEIIPLCLRTMETGLELSKTVAIFIVQKIILDDTGLNYICQTYERFYAVGTALSNMVNQLVNQQSVRLLKHVIRCYLRLSENIRAREALRQCLPQPLRDSTFARALKDDPHTRRCLNTLLMNISDTTK